MKGLILLLAVPLLAPAQVGPVDLTAPVAAYRFHSGSGALQTIDGIPGAASFGAPLAIGLRLEGAFVAPHQRLALGWAPGAEHFVRISLHGATAAAERTAIGVGRVFFSPSGDTAAIAAASRAEVWTSLSGQPSRLATYTLDGPVDALAISDDGAAMVARVGGKVHLLGSDAGPELPEGITDLAFLRDSHDLLLLDSASLTLLRKADPDRQETLAEHGGRALRVSGDGQVIAVLAGEQFLRLWNRSGAALASFDAGSPVTAFGGAGLTLFQISTESGDVLLLDSAASDAQLTAVAEGSN